MSVPVDRIARAKAVGIETELARRGHHLKPQGQELVGPCPLCGGTDRFGVHLIRQVWNCRGCRAGGDVISLVRHIDGSSFQQAIATLTGEDRRTPVLSTPEKTQARDNATTTQSALRIWSEARPIAGTLAETYLRRRGLTLPPAADECLGFHPEVVFGKTEEGGWRYVPCLLGLVRHVISNEPIGLQRIGLTQTGYKIDRMALGNIAGGAVTLWDDAEVTQGLIIGEGIETTLAAATRIEHRTTLLQPAWAVLSAGNMAGFPILPGVEALTLLVDNDVPDRMGHQRGQDSAAACATRWSDAGREVCRLMLRQAGADFNDAVLP